MRSDGNEKLEVEHVLLVEDDPVIAIDAEAVLQELGADVVTLAATAAQGLKAIEAKRPDVALLDVNLGQGTSEPVARMLDALGIPFALTTGDAHRSDLPAAFRARPICTKPYGADDLSRVLEQAMTGAGAT